MTTSFRPDDYHVEAGRMDVQFVTPVVIACLEVAADKEAAEYRDKRQKGKGGVKSYAPGKDFYEWRQYAGDYRPVVRVQAVPEIAMTGGSVFAVIMLGPNVPTRFKFKTDSPRRAAPDTAGPRDPFPGRPAATLSASESGLNRLSFRFGPPGPIPGHSTTV